MLFILNKQEKVVGMLKNGGNANSLPFFDDLLTEDLVTGAETFKFSTFLNDSVAENLIIGNYIAFMKDEKYKLFQIVQTEESHDQTLNIDVYCESAGLGLLNDVFRGRSIPSASIREFLNTLLEDSSWNVGAIDYGIQDVFDLELDTGSVYAILQNNISKYGAELEFRVEINRGRISRKFIDVYKFRGRNTGKRFEFGKNISGLKRKVDSTELFTGLIGIGNNGLSFKSITVPEINKPDGQDFVFDEEAFNQFNHNGNHLMGVYQYETDSPEELLRATYKKLQEVKQPKIAYEVDVELLGTDVGIGDTVNIIDMFFPNPILLHARVSKLETSFTNPDNNKCVLANFIEASTNISKDLLSQLEGFVNGTISDRFPIKNEDISQGAVTGDKIYQNSISTDHLMADSVDANSIKANSIKTKHLETGSVTADKIDTTFIDAIEGKFETIESNFISVGEAIIGKADIGTVTAISGKIENLEATVATIEDLEATNARIENLVAKDAEIENILAGNITAENIQTGAITAESGIIKDLSADVIKTGTLDASLANIINLNASSITTGTLDASKILVTNLDASQITSGKINADIIEGLSISANDITTGTLDASLVNVVNLNASNITSGRINADLIEGLVISGDMITAGTLDASLANVINLNASNINTGTLDASKVKVSNLNAGSITSGELDASKVNISKLNASNISTGTLNGQLVNVTNLNASNINSGTLDASKINVTNLKADSITAGSITVLGENLLHQAAFIPGKMDKWVITKPDEAWFVDEEVKFEGVNSMRYSVDWLTENKWYSIKSEEIPCTNDEVFVASAYFMTRDAAAIDGVVNIEIEYYDNVAKAYITSKWFPINFAPSGTWKRFVFQTKSPIEHATKMRFRITPAKNGTLWLAKPMLSRGSIASVWKEHNDELISDGAINEDKLGNNSITSSKLNLEELFVSDSAFIMNLTAVELRAEQITTGKISSERLDIAGIVGFESFTPDIKENFIFDTTGNKTFINGGQLYTNSVTAEKINAKGLTVLDDMNNTTFSIDSRGEVFVTGTIQSANFDESKNFGYKISKDGNIIMNDAIVRGDVLLPNAGITNFGDRTPGINLFEDASKEYPKPSREYLGVPITNLAKKYLNEDITISFDLKTSGKNGNINVYSLGRYMVGFNKSCAATTTEWKRYSLTGKFTYGANEDPNGENCNLSFYGQYDSGVFPLVKNIKIELGHKKGVSEWTPYASNTLNPVRLWAGTDFSERDSAPFKVLQDGSFIATKGEIGGTFTGELHIGNIHISDRNDTVANFEIKTNNDVETIVKLTDELSYINSSFIFGNPENKIISFDRPSKNLRFNKSSITILNEDGTTTNINKNNSLIEFNNHSLKYNNNSLEFNSNVDDGNFAFKNKNGNVVVDVEGEVNVDNIIRLGEMKIAKRTEKGNEGCDFIL